MRSFPTRADYVAWHKGLGTIEDETDLIEKKNSLVSEIFYDWIKRLQLACLFAKKIAHKPKEAGYQSLVLPHAVDDPNLGEYLSNLLDATADHQEAVQLVFPDIREPHELVQLVNVLCRDDRWYWTEPESKNSSTRLIGLRWTLPGGKAVNHVLGFSPVDSMPLTRQAPFTALVLRIRAEKRARPVKKENGLIQVHLADMDSGLDPDRHEKFWESTEKQRALLVEQEKHDTAKAKVTFCVSIEEAGGLVDPLDVEIKEVEEATEPG